jgi:hypothetical protein
MEMSGTSIQDLHQREQMEQMENMRRMQELQQAQYGGMQNHQYEQGHNAAHVIQQAQHNPYYNSQHQPSDRCPTNFDNIENLARDISDNLPADGFSAGVSDLPEEEDLVIVETKKNGGYLNKVPKMLREPLIIVVLFVILSQPIIRDNIAKYVRQINPDMDGKVPFVGILIYGLIFAVLFTLAKKFLMN